MMMNSLNSTQTSPSFGMLTVSAKTRGPIKTNNLLKVANNYNERRGIEVDVDSFNIRVKNDSGLTEKQLEAVLRKKGFNVIQKGIDI